MSGSPYLILQTWWLSWFCLTSACCLHTLLHNYKHMKSIKLCANHGAVGTLESFQWCGEPHLNAHTWVGVNSNTYFKALGFNHFYVQSPCNPLIEDYTDIFYMIRDKQISSVFFYMICVPALTPCFNSNENSLLSENITLFAVSHTYRNNQQRGLDRNHLQVYCTL
jgi:hypothetical protein